MHGSIKPLSHSARRLRRAHTGAMLAAAGVLAVASTVFLGGCEAEKKIEIDDEDFQLPAGEHGLRKLSREQYPDLTPAFNGRDDKFSRAIDYSAQWFLTGTSRQNYSSEQMGPLSQVITGGHDHAAASVYAFRELMSKVRMPRASRMASTSSSRSGRRAATTTRARPSSPATARRSSRRASRAPTRSSTRSSSAPRTW